MSQTSNSGGTTKNYLREFYAVTVTSLYRAVIYGEPQVPWLEKISVRERSKIALGEKIKNGTMVSIGSQLELFVPEGSGSISPNSTIQREITMVNTRFHGGCTSKVVALFLDERKAMQCHDSVGLTPCDPRWKKDTIAVLKAIHREHPYCSISTVDARFWLLPPSEWQKIPLP